VRPSVKGYVAKVSLPLTNHDSWIRPFLYHDIMDFQFQKENFYSQFNLSTDSPNRENCSIVISPQAIETAISPLVRNMGPKLCVQTNIGEGRFK